MFEFICLIMLTFSSVMIVGTVCSNYYSEQLQKFYEEVNNDED
jgi:hypothetical protein